MKNRRFFYFLYAKKVEFASYGIIMKRNFEFEKGGMPCE